MAVLAAAVMANELLPALHFLMWVWGAGASGFNCAAGHVIYSGFEASGESDPNEKP